jgi:hypothetical protein
VILQLDNYLFASNLEEVNQSEFEEDFIDLCVEAVKISNDEIFIPLPETVQFLIKYQITGTGQLSLN